MQNGGVGGGGVGGYSQTPQFGNFNYGGMQPPPTYNAAASNVMGGNINGSFSKRTGGASHTLSNPVAKEGEVQRVENLIDAIDALLK